MRVSTAAVFVALSVFCLPLYATCTFGFLSPTPYSANEKPGDVTTGDFNHDGYVDVVVQNRTVGYVSILLGTAGGGLGSPTKITTDYAQGDIQAAYIDADNDLDLVLSIPWSNNFTVYPHLQVLLGNGNGTFTSVPYTDQQLVYQNPDRIVLGDFNGDGKMDAATDKYNAEWSSMQNIGGKFAQKAAYTTGGLISSGLATGDFDGDGKADVALVAYYSKKVYLFFGVGDGTFTAGAATLDFPHETREPRNIGAGDFNADGKDDLAIQIVNTSGSGNAPLKIALSNGVARTFASPVDAGDVPQAYELLVRDMDGDGQRDVVLGGSNALVVMRGLGGGAFLPPQSFGSYWHLGIAIDDFDRDGGPDVVGTMFGSGQVGIYLNTCGRVTLNLTSSANPAAQGTPITLTGTLVPPAAVAPTGTITLKSGMTTLGTANLTAGTTLQRTLSDLTPATYAISFEYSGDSRFAPTVANLQQTVTVPPFGPPPGLNAISFGGPVQLAWYATANTDHYEVWRNNGAGWTFVGNAPNASFQDNGAPSTAALLYKVRAIAANSTASGFSAVELALTYSFTDATLTPKVTRVKRVHLTELRSAANAVRALAALGAYSWAEPSPTRIRASHVIELRTAIAAARSSLGLAAASYTDDPLNAGTAIKAVHFEQLRGAMR